MTRSIVQPLCDSWLLLCSKLSSNKTIRQILYTIRYDTIRYDRCVLNVQ